MAKSSLFQKIAVGTAIAGAAGYVAGVLSAPKEGKRTRRHLKKVADRNIIDLEKQLKELHTEMSQLMGSAKKSRNEMSGQSYKKLTSALNNATGAKDKLRQVISSIHEGEPSDKDLAKALDDAKRSLEHLKNFIKK